MEYIGVSAPFYVSRWRLQNIGDRAAGAKWQVSGGLDVQGLGKIEISRASAEPTLSSMIEQAVNWLDKNDAIGLPDEGKQFSWLSLNGRFTTVTNNQTGIDHLVCVDESMTFPSELAGLLIGARANLTSITEELPKLGSSPLAIQEIIEQLSYTSPLILQRQDTLKSRPGNQPCQVIAQAIQSVIDEEALIRWPVMGVVENLLYCSHERNLLASPLFLSYFRP